jgi:hypothetical protein
MMKISSENTPSFHLQVWYYNRVSFHITSFPYDNILINIFLNDEQ